MLSLAPRPDFTKREGSPCPKSGWESLASVPAGWALAEHSVPAAQTAAPAAKPAPACFRNRLRPNRLESMLASRDPNLRFELCLCPNVLATQLFSVQQNRQRVN